jgi:hypothetical protein
MMRAPSSWLGNVLAHAPQLTRSWGPFRAFLTVFGIVAMIAAAVRPEIAYVPVSIYLVAVAAALIADHKNWL